MGQLLEIGAKVTTPLGLLGFALALAFLSYSRRLKNKELLLANLPTAQRAQAIDKFLSRYGLDAGNLTREQKYRLLVDELQKRHQIAHFAITISATTFLVCFLFVVVAVLMSKYFPTSPAKVIVKIIDRDTGETILRSDFKLKYSLQGDEEHRICEGARGQCEIPSGTARITFEDLMDCEGYEFRKKDQPESEQRRVWLIRKEDGEEFENSIKPRDPLRCLSGMPGPMEFKEVTERELDPKTIELTIHNSTDNYIDIFLYQWSLYDNPSSRIVANPIALLLCEPGGRKVVNYFGLHPGYYLVFASRFGQEAEFLAFRNLYLETKPQIYIESEGRHLYCGVGPPQSLDSTDSMYSDR